MAQATVNERMKNYLQANPPATAASTDLTTNISTYITVNRGTGEATAAYLALIAAAATS